MCSTIALYVVLSYMKSSILCVSVQINLLNSYAYRICYPIQKHLCCKKKQQVQVTERLKDTYDITVRQS